MPSVATNLEVFRAIAEEAAAEARRLSEAGRTAHPGGGSIMQWDQDRRAFKQSLIALAFAGSYFETLLRVIGTVRLGPERYKKLEFKRWEEKLKALGITDAGVLARCERFREARNEVMHEKPLPLVDGTVDVPLIVGQTECEHAIAFVQEIAKLLGEP